MQAYGQNYGKGPPCITTPRDSRVRMCLSIMTAISMELSVAALVMIKGTTHDDPKGAFFFSFFALHSLIIIIATIIVLDLWALSGLTKFSPESASILKGALMITHDCSGKKTR